MRRYSEGVFTDLSLFTSSRKEDEDIALSRPFPWRRRTGVRKSFSRSLNASFSLPLIFLPLFFRHFLFRGIGEGWLFFRVKLSFSRTKEIQPAPKLNHLFLSHCMRYVGTQRFIAHGNCTPLHLSPLLSITFCQATIFKSLLSLAPRTGIVFCVGFMGR